MDPNRPWSHGSPARGAVAWRAPRPGSFAVVLANGRVGSGSFGIFLNDPVTVSNRRAVNGTLDGNGRILLQIPTNVPVGSYQLLFSYGGETAQIATVSVR